MKYSILVNNVSDQGNVISLDPNQWLLPETKEYLTGHVPKKPTEEEEETQSK